MTKDLSPKPSASGRIESKTLKPTILPSNNEVSNVVTATTKLSDMNPDELVSYVVNHYKMPDTSEFERSSEGQLTDILTNVKITQISTTFILNGLSIYRKRVSDSLINKRQARGRKPIKHKDGEILDIAGSLFKIENGVPIPLKE